MHEMEFGKADSFSDQSTAPSTKGKMVALNALGIPFSSYDGTVGYVFFICVIGICVNRFNMERRQQCP